MRRTQKKVKELPEVIPELQAIDDEALVLDKKYEVEYSALLAKYHSLRKPILKERAALLAEAPANATNAEKNLGTPGLKGFWLQALINNPHTDMTIYEHDEEVLDYLRDINVDFLDKKESHKGFKLTFKFKQNPYFTNKELVKEYWLNQPVAWRNHLEIQETKSTEIDWKDGKNVTMNKRKSKSKPGTTKEEPQESFFRLFFSNLKKGAPMPNSEVDDYNDEADSEYILDHDYTLGVTIKDKIIPRAIHWFTGAASSYRDDSEYSDFDYSDYSDNEEDKKVEQ